MISIKLSLSQLRPPSSLFAVMGPDMAHQARLGQPPVGGASGILRGWSSWAPSLPACFLFPRHQALHCNSVTLLPEQQSNPVWSFSSTLASRLRDPAPGGCASSSETQIPAQQAGREPLLRVSEFNSVNISLCSPGPGRQVGAPFSGSCYLRETLVFSFGLIFRYRDGSFVSS